MPTSKSIEPNSRGLAASCSSSRKSARNPPLDPWLLLVIFLGMLCSVCLVLEGMAYYTASPNSFSGSSLDKTKVELPDTADYPAPITVFKAESAEALINKLKKNHLWEIKPGNSITPLLLASYPSDLDTLSIQEKKKTFLHSLLPAALVTDAEIAKERETLLAIVDKIPLPLSAFTFSGPHKDWQKYVDKGETNFLMELCRKYRTRRVEKLLKRVNIIPVSLILAQGALESSWGTSRFTREGNSLFGLWTWSKDGIIPANREEGKNHKIEAYDSILASLRKYTLTLNRLDAYADFRAIRTKSLDSYKLAEGLELYSERGEDYITDIKKVISGNNLTKFDEVQFPNVLVSMLPPQASQFSADTIAQL